MDRKESFEDNMLRTLCKVYVIPTTESVKKFHDNRIAPSTTTSKMRKSQSSIFGRTASSFQPGTVTNVTHQFPLYTSVMASERVLASNRSTYTKVMSTMRLIESNKYQEKTQSVIAEKRKFEFFRTKTRRSRHAKGIFVYSGSGSF